VRAAEGLEQLEAQLDVKKAHVKAAEVEVAAAKAKRAHVAEQVGEGAAVLDEARFAIQAAQAQLDIRKAEVREIEVRIKLAKTGGEVKAVAPAAAAPRPAVAVFNMAAVMRDYHNAKYQVYLLSQKRQEMSTELVKARAEYADLQQAAQGEADPRVREDVAGRLKDLANRIAKEDGRINKVLNDEASKIISRLYDAIQAQVTRAAERHGYEVVLAYPDASTPEERASPHIKELKLKPPAAQPFFVSKRVDITEELVKAINAADPPLDAAGKPVDVSKLPPVPPPPTPAVKP
jgi:Skp family chaperone for outer membrane proteins